MFGTQQRILVVCRNGLETAVSPLRILEIMLLSSRNTGHGCTKEHIGRQEWLARQCTLRLSQLALLGPPWAAILAPGPTKF